MNAPNPTTDDQLALPLVPPSRDADLAARIMPGWQLQAACAETPGDVFYPEPAHRGASVEADEAVALAVCNRCRVRSSCRAAALVNDEKGVWGGTNAKVRDRMRTALSDGASVDAVLVETIPPRPDDEGAVA